MLVWKNDLPKQLFKNNNKNKNKEKRNKHRYQTKISIKHPIVDRMILLLSLSNLIFHINGISLYFLPGEAIHTGASGWIPEENLSYASIVLLLLATHILPRQRSGHTWHN